jgi:hypothetical protein
MCNVARAVCTEVLCTLLVDWRMPGERTRQLSFPGLPADDLGERARSRPLTPSQRSTAQ